MTAGNAGHEGHAAEIPSPRATVLPDEHATREAGAALARAVANADSNHAFVIHLHGNLGAGKTTLARAFVQALQPDARVKSPTYTLVESYDTPRGTVLHLDLYRIADPGELDFLGLADLASGASAMLIEWPGKGGDATPKPDVDVHLLPEGNGRRLEWRARSQAGESVLQSILGGGA